MLSIDTNIIVRVVTNDDAEQARKAAKLLAREQVYVTKSVLLETEWVLRYSYGLSRDVIVDALRRFISLPNAAVEDSDHVVLALENLAAGMDFADALHLAASVQTGRFATFDAKLARQGRKLGFDIVTP